MLIEILKSILFLSTVVIGKDFNFDDCDHSFSKFAKFSEKPTFLTPLIRTRTDAYQGLRNISFSENFANVLNE